MDIINIHLPQKDNKYYIAVSFDYGFLNESDKKFGLGHLVEHYVACVLSDMYKAEEVYGQISDTHLTFFLYLNKSQYKKFTEDDFTATLNTMAGNINLNILNNEKSRIEIELEEKYSDTSYEISTNVKSKIIITPKKIGRGRLKQLENLNSFSEKDVSSFISRLVKVKKTTFVGFNKNKDNYEELKFKIEKEFSEIEFSKIKNHKFKNTHKILKKANNFIVAFEGLKEKEELEDRIALGFLVKNVYEKFDDVAQKFGVYQTDYDNQVFQDYGYLWFSASSYSKLDKDMVRVFFSAVEEVIEDKALSKDIKKYIKEKQKNIKKDWKDNNERFEWVVYDILDDGVFTSLENYLKAFENLSVKKVLEIAKRIFNLKKSFVFNKG